MLPVPVWSTQQICQMSCRLSVIVMTVIREICPVNTVSTFIAGLDREIVSIRHYVKIVYFKYQTLLCRD